MINVKNIQKVKKKNWDVMKNYKAIERCNK